MKGVGETIAAMLRPGGWREHEIMALRSEVLTLREAWGRTIRLAKEAQEDARLSSRMAVTADNEVHSVIAAVTSMLDQMEAHAGRGRLTKTAVQLYREETSKLIGRKI